MTPFGVPPLSNRGIRRTHIQKASHTLKSLIQMPDSLPPYTSPPTPIYSASPGPDEQILQRTHPPGHSRHTGTFTRKKHGITVVLDCQKENIVCPSFGRNGLLSGTLFIESRENVTAIQFTMGVLIQLVGVIECSLSGGHSSSQLRIALTAESDSRPSDIHCDLFVPSLGVFGISETIPFHLQLSGSTHRLRNLFIPPSDNPIVRVSLLRQIAIETIGQKTNTILENCPLRPLPPGIFGLHSSTSDDTLNWEGEIQLQNISTQSFDVGTIKVMYLIAVEFTPPKTSGIRRAYHGCPIKVTTDTWVGSAELGIE
ncbi:hypothetical protein C8R45DRAFT_1125506 [Mycena sanguinolenta]|nr:hypothetical protein C8R45DRAFT_1125506 [Mycena sanguinolenta]